jgi:hypothetical protein
MSPRYPICASQLSKIRANFFRHPFLILFRQLSIELGVGVSVIGYLWFLIRFPVLDEGDTVKASYLLHIFPPLALLTADFLLRMRVPVVPWLIAWGMLMIHNISAMTTHATDLHLGIKGYTSQEAPSYRSDEP